MADKKETRKQSAIRRFFRETIGELRKVNWPTRREATQLTIIVLVVMTIVGIILGLTEAGASALLSLLLGI